MWKVTLKRGDRYDDRTWEHKHKWEALRRVRELCDLHSCDHEMNVGDQHLIVDASTYYDGS